jgi:hypothetical protein
MNSIWSHPFPLQIYINETYPFHLRIKNITKLNKGDKLELICLDKNIDDLTSHHEKEKVMAPINFFDKSYKGTYIHDHDLCGTFQFENIDDEPQFFEFHIEWNELRWYPLKDGKLQSNEQFDFPIEYENKSWKEFSDNTRIGWRGPMLLKKHLKYTPKIYRMDIAEHQDEINNLLIIEHISN